MRKEGDKIIYHSKLEIDALDIINGANKPRTVLGTFDKHTPMNVLHSFISHSIETYHMDVETNDHIVGPWDIQTFLRNKYKITIELIPHNETSP